MLSAGLQGAGGKSTPHEIQEVARLKSIELSGHASAGVTEELLRQSDLIVVMDLENYGSLLAKWPEVASKTTMLGLFAFSPQVEIPDPYGATKLKASEIFDSILEAVRGLSDWMESNRKGQTD